MSSLRRLRICHDDDDVTTHVTSLDQVDECPTETDKVAPPAGAVDIAYTTLGTGPHKLVFIAGMCVPHTMWTEQIAHFTSTKSHTLLLIDNRGVGESTAPAASNLPKHSDSPPTPETTPPRASAEPRYTIPIMARDVLAVVDHAFGSEAPIHVVGHSMGSMIAQRVALLAPHRIASLSLLCGHDGGWFWNHTSSLRLLRAGLTMLTAREDPDLLADVYLQLHFTSAYLNTAAQPDETPTHGAHPQAPPHAESKRQAQPRRTEMHKRYTDGIRNSRASCSAFWGHIRAVRSHHLRQGDADKLRKLTCPKLVVYGREDAVVLPRASRQLAGRIGAHAVGVHAAHFAMQEAAAEINALLSLHVAFAAKVWDGGLVGGDEVVPNACVRLVRQGGCDEHGALVCRRERILSL